MGDEWETPDKLFDFLNQKCGGFDIDVCANARNKKVPKYFYKAQNGLNQEWKGVCWCNPPYSNIEPWVDKAIMETRSGSRTVIYMLIPANTDTSYFKKVFENACEIIFIKGRLTFKGEQNYPARFPSCVVIFDNAFSWDHPFFWLMDKNTFEIQKISD
jgi:phage N-6-adenine-methyltransferase